MVSQKSIITPVAVGVIWDTCHRVLVAKRPNHVFQGGLWEFPGGKLEKGETPKQALHRELREELGIEVIQCQALIKVYHYDTNYAVLLDVWRVCHYLGKPKGCEGQRIRWVTINTLKQLPLLLASQKIVNYLVNYS